MSCCEQLLQHQTANLIEVAVEPGLHKALEDSAAEQTRAERDRGVEDVN